MTEAGGQAAAEVEGSFQPRKIDQAETYRRINVKRQLQFAKHVLAERKALDLARRFEDEQEQYWKDKAAAMKFRDQSIQDRRFRAVRDSQQLAAISGRMQVEERNQVASMIREARERKEE